MSENFYVQQEEPEEPDEKPLDGECADEDCAECKSCGESHEEIDITATIKKQKKEFRILSVLYLVAMGVVDYCFYELGGLWAAVAGFFGYLTYFFHMNMARARGMVEGLSRLQQQAAMEQFSGMMPGVGPPPPPRQGGNPEHTGQYL